MKVHRTDGVSLSFSLIFFAIVAWWVVAQVADIRLPALGWLVAAGLILFGGFGLLGALRSGRAEPAPPVEADASVAPVSGVPPELHADIVRELLHGPQHHLPAEPVTAPPATAPPATAPARSEAAPPAPVREERRD